MERIDLDAARAARREARGESPVLVFMGSEYELAPEMPLELVELVVQLEQVGNDQDSGIKVFGILERMFKVVLGEHYDRFKASGATLQDLGPLIAGIEKVYGLSLGESLASGSSLNRAGRRSRRTSKPTTGSTSVKSIGAMG